MAEPSAGAADDGSVTAGNLRKAVRNEVLRAIQDEGVAKEIAARVLSDSKSMGIVEGAVVQFLKKDFDKVLALGADAYHFRRWDELQAQVHELRQGHHPGEEASHARQLVGSVCEKHAALASDVLALRERLGLVGGRIAALEDHSKANDDGFEVQKASQMRAIDSQALGLRESLQQELRRFSDTFRKEMGRLEQEVQSLHRDRTWLHRQEEALTGRCRVLEKRVEENAIWNKDSHETTKGAAEAAKQDVSAMSSHFRETHASLGQLRDTCDVLQNAIASAEAANEARMEQHAASFKAELGEVEARHQKMHKDFEEVHGATDEARINEVVDQKLVAELEVREKEIKMLHEKLEVSVLRGYEAVEAQFRTALEEQANALRAELAKTQESQYQIHEELRQIAPKEGHEAVESRITEALGQQLDHRIGLLGARHEEIHNRLRTQFQSQLKSVHEELQVATTSGDEAIEARVKAALEHHVSSLGARVEASEQGVERRHQEVTQAHQELRTAMARGDEAVEARLSDAMNERLSKTESETFQENFRAVGKECAHKLQAISYSLLEVIAEVQLMGTSSEVKEKRAQLHHRLCDRLGTSRIWSPKPSEPGEATSAPGSPSTRSAAEQSSQGQERAPPEQRRIWRDPPVHVDLGEAPLYLPPVQKPTTPRAQKSSPGKFRDSIREIRSLRLVDHGADWLNT